MSQQSHERRVFVVHGRNLGVRDDMFKFLRALDLRPIEWSEAVSLTGQGSPYIGDILEAAFNYAQAIVVLLTPDEIAYLRNEYASHDGDPDLKPMAQPRPNVLFEAGMAFGKNPSRTVLVEIGANRAFSDVAGRHVVRMDGSPARRQDLVTRLKSAGCAIDASGTDWLTEGAFNAPSLPGGGLPLGKRVPVQEPGRIRLNLTYQSSGRGGGKLQVRNMGRDSVYDLNFEMPEGITHYVAEVPLDELPAGKTASFPVSPSMGSGPNKFKLKIVGRTAEGERFEVPEFVDIV